MAQVGMKHMSEMALCVRTPDVIVKVSQVQELTIFLLDAGRESAYDI